MFKFLYCDNFHFETNHLALLLTSLNISFLSGKQALVLLASDAKPSSILVLDIYHGINEIRFFYLKVDTKLWCLNVRF